MLTGLHHVTVIAGDAQENLDFYTRVLGMRLVKRSVNQDVPDTYHLFYADAVGHAGTDLTFFPWPRQPKGRRGHGLTNEVALAVPAGSLDWWAERLAGAGVALQPVELRFGERALPFDDPHGLAVALVETADPREFAQWDASPVPVERQVRGLHAVRLVERDLAATARFLVEVLGFARGGEEGGWHRFVAGGEGGTPGRSGRIAELRAARPDEARGAWGTGAVHHIAWRVPDEGAERAVQARVAIAGRRPTDVIDRFWFKSVYFTEPGGALIELATDGPGFAVDEDPAHLGESLVLPPWLEPHRTEIEAALPVLR